VPEKPERRKDWHPSTAPNQQPIYGGSTVAHTSLRADSASCNVVRLPTAAPSKINQPTRAAREYRREQPAWPGVPMTPAKAEAKALTVHRSPELLIALCILKALPVEQRAKAQDAVHWLAFHAGDDVSQLASSIVARLDASR